MIQVHHIQHQKQLQIILLEPGLEHQINYLITNCSNNFGPRQYTEKLIPKAINLLLDNKKSPFMAMEKILEIGYML